MTEDLSTLIKRLETEKFNGKKIGWLEGHWGDINVRFISDKDDYYFMHGKVIWKQPINGKPEERMAHCYSCSSEMQIQERTNSIWYKDSLGQCAGCGEVKKTFIPYCLNCEPEPMKHGVIYE